MRKSDFRVHIIGAGVAGTTAALHLQDAGIPCMIFEKSRGAGGRLSTRRTRDGFHFDHGAQYFTARSQDFLASLARSPWADNVKAWSPTSETPQEGENWYVGAPAMNAPLRAAAAQLDIRLNATVERIDRRETGWQLSGTNLADAGLADMVIISAPAPQARALTPFSSDLQDMLSNIKYDPCWALMVAFEKSTASLPPSLRQDAGVFSWVAQNSAKPDRNDDVETWIAHASTEWSKEYLELDKDDAANHLLPILSNLIGAADRHPIYLAAHRWRFARVAEPIGKPYLTDETGTVFVASDGCLGPRVECAFESGLAAAEYVLNTLNV